MSLKVQARTKGGGENKKNKQKYSQKLKFAVT